MKKILIYFAALVTLMACGNAGDDLGKTRTHSFSEVEKMFANPGKEFRPAPLWTWNARVTHEDIDRMLSDFKDQGFGGAFIHPRPGLETEYLSDEWFELWRYSVEKGKEIGLDIWIYDEDSYPSGFAGGHVQREMPESYDHPTSLEPVIADNLPDDMKDYVACLKREGDNFIDITGRTEEYADVPGTYYLYKGIYRKPSRQNAGLPYVDLLYPGVTDKFIEITMSGYEKEFGKELGPVIKGIFTDEPHYLNWSPALVDAFRQDWGYDILASLPMLHEEVGNWKQVRYDFLYTKHRLFSERWAQRWDKYCREHGLVWTGHYWEHAWPDFGGNADNMGMYEYHHMPAIDLLFNKFDDVSPHANWGNVRVVKELRSVANQMGYTRTLCESYGGAGWDLTFEDMKRLADWEYALGVNFMNQHYSNVTIEGARKLDYPDFFTGYSPWAKDYKVMNDHVARLSLALSQGEQMNDLLILEPTTTIWMYYTYMKDTPEVVEMGDEFQAFITGLEKAQVEYDLGSESIIARHGRVKADKFIVGGRAYSKVMIPVMVESLRPETAVLLEEFARQGGTVIALSKPVLANAAGSDILERLWNSGLDNIKESFDTDGLSSADVVFESVSGGSLYHQRREYEEGQLLFLTNSSLTEDTHVRLRLAGAGLKKLDTMTGEISAYPCTDNGDGTVSASTVLAPAGDIMLFAPKDGSLMDGLAVSPCRKSSDKVLDPVAEMEVERLGDNYLTLDYCKYSIDGRMSDETYVTQACTGLYSAFDMLNPWERNIQYKQEFIDQDTLKTGPVSVFYNFEIAEDFDWSDMKFICEKPGLWTVCVNGHQVEPLDGVHPLDARNGCYSIGQYVQKGVNEVVLSRGTMSILAEISFAFVAGDFSVIPTASGFVLKEPTPVSIGAWKEQGLPFYSWDVSYRAGYDIGDMKEAYVLKLGEWEGTVCEVSVNGIKAGIIGFQPYEMDITPFLKEGRNVVEVVCTGSLANLFGPHFSPREGMVKPLSWSEINERKSGHDYIFDGYGLFEPFEVSESSNCDY